MELLISFLSDWGYIALFICMALENMTSSGDPHFYLPSRRHRTLSSPPVYCLHDCRHNPVDDIPCIYRRNTRRKLDASS